VLARLARLQRVCVAATVDSILVPLWWTPFQRSCFSFDVPPPPPPLPRHFSEGFCCSWAWMEASTYLPYTDEEKKKAPPVPPEIAEEGGARGRAARLALDRLAQLSIQQRGIITAIVSKFSSPQPQKTSSIIRGRGSKARPARQAIRPLSLVEIAEECSAASVAVPARRLEALLADLVRDGFLKSNPPSPSSTVVTWSPTPSSLLLVPRKPPQSQSRQVRTKP
jgi:hypothetical protein